MMLWKRWTLLVIVLVPWVISCEPQTRDDGQNDGNAEEDSNTLEDSAPHEDTATPSDTTSGQDDTTIPPGDIGLDVETGPLYTYYRNIEPILEGLCQRCHSEGGIAPFTLKSYDDIYPVRWLVRDATKSRIMPPWPGAPGCNDYQHDWSLDDATISMIEDWVRDDAPEGDPSETPVPFSVPPANELSRVDLTLTMPEPYTPAVAPDDYRCFPIDWPESTERFVTGMDIHPGNDETVHHVIVFLVAPEYAQRVANQDDRDPGPGYTCFGLPNIPLDITTEGPSLSALAFWAPGMGGVDFPENTGLKVRPGSKLVVQVHYNIDADSTPAPDQTSFSFKISDSVEREGMMLPVVDYEWVGSQKMAIPAGEPEVTHEGSLPLGLALSLFDLPDTFKLHMVGVHMHLLGKSATVTHKPFGNQPQCLLDVPAWDFNWQFTFWLENPIDVGSLDELSIRCTWDNSAANQPLVDGQPVSPIDVFWGEGTRDEMCLGLLYVSFPPNAGTP